MSSPRSRNCACPDPLAGNFASGYRWRDGIGPKKDRSARMELAWHAVESNHFGTDAFIQFCRQLGTEPYLTVNCGDGDMREAGDGVGYCNGTQNTALANLRRKHGHDAPRAVKYWSIGNKADGPWQIGFKTPQEYARACTEFAKVMRWTVADLKTINTFEKTQRRAYREPRFPPKKQNPRIRLRAAHHHRTGV
jgi:alpha-N-arabinofuranosidase